MTLQNRLIAPAALALTGSLCLIANGQSAQDNVFDADGASGGTSDFETPGNWSEDGPPWTNNEIDGGVVLRPRRTAKPTPSTSPRVTRQST